MPFTYVTRAEWGARPPKGPYTGIADSEGIAVHHQGSKSQPPASFTAAVAKMRGIQNYHMDTQGWNDFAYGWGVGAGKVFEGRNWGSIDGADTGVGRLMHSVVWLGDSDAYPVSSEDLNAIESVIREHARRYPRRGDNIKGHGQINSTDCPGNNLQRWIDAGRPVTSPPDPVTPPKTGSHKMLSTTLTDKRLVEFMARPQDGLIIHRWQTAPHSGPWSPWALLNNGPQPGAFNSVEASTNSDGRCEIVAWHTGYNALFTCYQLSPSGQWSGWSPIPY